MTSHCEFMIVLWFLVCITSKISFISCDNHITHNFGSIWWIYSAFQFGFTGSILLFEAIAWGGIFPCWPSSRKPCCYRPRLSCLFWFWNDGGYSSPLSCGANSNGNSCLNNLLIFNSKFLLCVYFWHWHDNVFLVHVNAWCTLHILQKKVLLLCIFCWIHNFWFSIPYHILHLTCVISLGNWLTIISVLLHKPSVLNSGITKPLWPLHNISDAC